MINIHNQLTALLVSFGTCFAVISQTNSSTDPQPRGTFEGSCFCAQKNLFQTFNKN